MSIIEERTPQVMRPSAQDSCRNFAQIGVRERVASLADVFPEPWVENCGLKIVARHGVQRILLSLEQSTCRILGPWRDRVGIGILGFRV